MTTERYRVEVWEERDRLGIWVTDEATGDVVFEVWDDDARQHFEDGFLKPGKELKDSVLGYLRERKMIRKQEVQNMDMGWTKHQDQIEANEDHKCEVMRRAFGLIVSNDPDAYDRTGCELTKKCGMCLE